MPFYASRFTGSGTEDDPFRPVAADAASDAGAAWQSIDLRADSTRVTGWAFVWTAVALSPLPTGVLLVAAGPDAPLAAGVRSAIKVQLGVTLATGLTFRQALRQFLTSESRLDGTRWAPLVADTSGQLQIVLGDHVDVWQG